MTTGCGIGQAIVDQTTSDKIDYFEKGKCYERPKRVAFTSLMHDYTCEDPTPLVNYQRLHKLE
jgi:hypothetical protein